MVVGGCFVPGQARAPPAALVVADNLQIVPVSCCLSREEYFRLVPQRLNEKSAHQGNNKLARNGQWRVGS